MIMSVLEALGAALVVVGIYDWLGLAAALVVAGAFLITAANVSRA